MRHRLPLSVRQYGTHEELIGHVLPPAGLQGSRVLDAIVVPASRTAGNLEHAITLARAAGCQLVVICSRDARADDIGMLLASRSFAQATVIELPEGYSHPLLEFSCAMSASDDILGACAGRSSDLSTKRNLALILARMLGWRRIFYMDDDIRDISAGDMLRTVAMLESYNAVGMVVTDFPDNSVVCHAHRETGGSQDVFVSGAALAVDCARPVCFFPDIYNEDWLFFYDDVAGRHLGSSGLKVTQLRYDPFDDPRRAARQEFGDVIAEGLYSLLHQNRGASYADRDYWTQFLESRKNLHSTIVARSESLGTAHQRRVLDALRAASDCLAGIQPGLCERYVRLWQHDLDDWDQRFKGIGRYSHLTAALAEMGLAPSPGSAGQPDRTFAMAGNSLPGPVLIPRIATVDGGPAQAPHTSQQLLTLPADGAAQPRRPGLDRAFPGKRALLRVGAGSAQLVSRVASLLALSYRG